MDLVVVAVVVMIDYLQRNVADLVVVVVVVMIDYVMLRLASLIQKNLYQNTTRYFGSLIIIIWNCGPKYKRMLSHLVGQLCTQT